jgi:hypothetical protein
MIPALARFVDELRADPRFEPSANEVERAGAAGEAKVLAAAGQFGLGDTPFRTDNSNIRSEAAEIICSRGCARQSTMRAGTTTRPLTSLMSCARKETVTISYANKTFEYDVTQLPTAEARFLQLCNQTSAH